MVSISSIIIVAAVLLLVGPKKMQQAVVAALLLYCFPIQATLALVIIGIAYYFIHRRN
jgi:sterol desaturase/sphingolipid hydroxylase (fatty acid hydroxylase superfamily)